MTDTLPAPEDLEPHWPRTFTHNYGALSQSLIVAGDRVLGVSGNTIYAVDIYDGRLAKGFPVTVETDAGLHVTAAGGVIFYLANSKLMAIRLADAAPLPGWTPPAIKRLHSMFAVGDSLVVVHFRAGSAATMISVYAAATGEQRAGPVQISPGTAGSVAYGDRAAFFVANGVMNAANVDFGDSRWVYPEKGSDSSLQMKSQACVAGDAVAFATSSFIGVDVRSGHERWKVKASGTGAVTWFTPVVDATRTLAIAVNAIGHSAGEIVAVSIKTGEVAWRQAVADPGAPLVIGGDVFLTTDGNKNLLRLGCEKGNAIAAYKLPTSAGDRAPALGNGSMFIADAKAALTSFSFVNEPAAFFDGAGSRVDIGDEDGRFDFGIDDFTVEAWFKSSAGGEIVSSYPTSRDEDHHGFRFNLTENGELCVAVVNTTLKSLNVGKTAPTHANDGEWHHAALVRDGEKFRVVLDGQSLQVWGLDAPGVVNSVDGNNRLTIGAYVPGPNLDTDDEHHAPEAYFQGLIREVRIWSRALEVETINSNRLVELTGQEPRLKGLWALDDAHDPMNQVTERAGVFVKPRAVSTDLTFDDSAYPYLIHESKPQWPYAGTWGARGIHPVSTPSASSSSGIVAFGASTKTYAVREGDGHRVWSVSDADEASPPTGDGARFLVLTASRDLVAIDAVSGATTQEPGFGQLMKGCKAPFTAPAVSPLYIAAGSPSGEVRIRARRAPAAETRTIPSLGGAVRRMEFCGAGLVVSTGTKIHVIDPATGTLRGSVEVISPVFTIAGDSTLVCIRKDGLVRVDITTKDLVVLALSDGDIGIELKDITGLGAWHHSNVLVATTSKGAVQGLTLATLRPVWPAPQMLSAGASVHPPAFDDEGRVFCTTRSGVAAVLDQDTGALLGLYRQSKPISTPPSVDAGTACFGCDDVAKGAKDKKGEKLECDGALHNVVFGQTMVLRLGVDENGVARPEARGYALIDAERDDCTLHLMDVTRSCIEAWVNIPPGGGGGVASICPTKGADGFDLNLWIESDGRIHYTARSKEKKGWTGLHAWVASSVVDGTWHHVAVSRQSENDPVIYVDGLPLPGVVSDVADETPKHTVSGLKAFLGATANDDLEAENLFTGMIAEVRVWDTYLESTEIASRMHVKLRGDESDLLAYWNFDTEHVHDSARQGHDGSLVVTGNHPHWWLSDLAFTKPSYPEISTTATYDPSYEEGSAYTLTLTVKNADGTGAGGRNLDVWYVRHDDANDPKEIKIRGKTIKGILPGETADPGCSVETLPNGSITLRVETPIKEHGPSLDIRADFFMPKNERFHVNCLINTQELAESTPASLVAEAKLIQDYHYSPGNKIDHTRDRSTYRVVLTAANPDHSPRSNELVTLWASEPQGVEVDGRTLSLNPDNTVSVRASSVGEVVIVMEASDLSTPVLYARAGFMHRNDRLAVDAASVVHHQLATMQESTLTTPKVVNWRKDQTANDEAPLPASSAYAGQSKKVTEAVNRVGAAASNAPPPPRLHANLRMLRNEVREAAAESLSDMTQPQGPPRPDTVVTLRTTAGVDRRMPVNADAFLRALPPGHIGLVFAPGKTASDLVCDPVRDRPAVTALVGAPTPPVPMFGSIFGSIWHRIATTVVSIYDAAVSVAVFVEKTVTVVINKVTEVLEKYVPGAALLIGALKFLFNAIYLAVKKFIMFLRALLDWGGIRDSARLVKRMLTGMAGYFARPEFTQPVVDGIESLFKSLEQFAGLDARHLAGSSLTATSQGGRDNSGAQDGANGIHAKMMMHKLQDHGRGLPAMAGPAGHLEETIYRDFGDGIVDIAGDLVTLDFAALTVSLQNLLKKLAADVLEGAKDALIETVRMLAGGLASLLKFMDTPIHIPFLSALYEWIMDEPLSVLNVVCLLIGFPLHLVYFLVTDGRRFSDDASSWPLFSSLQAGEPAALGSGVPRLGRDINNSHKLGTDNRDQETAFVIMRVVNVLAVLGVDALYEPGVPDDFLRKGMRMLKGASGVFTSFWAWGFTSPFLEERIEQVKRAHPEIRGLEWEPDWMLETTIHLGLALGIVGDGLDMVKAAIPPAGAPPPEAPAGDPSALSKFLGLVQWVGGPVGKAAPYVAAVFATGQVGLQLMRFAKSKELSSTNPDVNMRRAAMFMAGRSGFFSCAKMVGVVYEPPFAGAMASPYARAGVAGYRLVANTAGITCHAIAVFDYFDLDHPPVLTG